MASVSSAAALILCFVLYGSRVAKSGIAIQPILKTITTEDGDIYDCFDIYKQPALDNPLLKNHTIQLKPSSLLRDTMGRSASSFRSSSDFKMIRRVPCPPRTVPVARGKKDYKGILSFMKFENHSSDSRERDAGGGLNPFWSATRTLPGKYYGARGAVSVYATPDVKNGQSSGAGLWISNEATPEYFNQILAGWFVIPDVYGDYDPHLTAAWGSDLDGHNGCINMLCSGFVQILRDIALGVKLANVSTYLEEQVYISLGIFQDRVTHNWWLLFGEGENLDNMQTLGYWPNHLFSSLSNFATNALWGGQVLNVGGDATPTSPPMGSGHYGEEGDRKAVQMKHMEVVDSGHNTRPLREDECLHFDTNRYCYRFYGTAFWPGNSRFLFGGPGGCYN